MLPAIGVPDIVGLAQRFVASRSEHRDVAISVLNGAIGDRLHEAGSPLAVEAKLLVGEGHSDAIPHPAPSEACLFVHGLMGSEHDWSMWSEGEKVVDYPKVLSAERDALPIFARYNTGLHISTNGRALSQHLEMLVERWPQLETLSVVAHSMGGLVVRSACHYGLEAGHTWVAKLQRVMLLGVPSHGATMEQLAHVASFTLEAIWNPWTKLVGKAINMRSAGIKDLRHGFVLDEDWRNLDVDQLRLAAPRVPTTAPHVKWYIAVASLGAPGSTMGKLVGDGAVLPRSAQGQGFGTDAAGVLAGAEVCVFHETSHARLLRDPAVLEQILQWWPAEP